MANETDGVVEDSSAQADLDAWATQKPEEQAQGETPAEQDAELESIAARDRAPKGKGAAKPPVRRPKTAAPVQQAAPAEKTEKTPPAPYDPNARITMTIDGEQITDTVQNWLRNAQKNGAAERRFQEANKALKDAETLRDLMTKDQRAALKQLGVDPLEFASKLVAEEIERERLAKENPAELEKRALAEENKRLKEEQTRREQEVKQAEEARIAQQYRQQYDAQFSAALQKADLPATPYTISRMASLMQENLRRGLDLSADEITQLVHEDLAKENAATLGKMKAEQAVKFLPKSFLDDLRKYDLAQVRSGANRVRPAAPAPLPHQARPSRTRTTSIRDAQDALDKWASGR